MKVRTRFAPSPTGYLHVGGVRTALFAWLIARQAGGTFILRLEDTDKGREVEGSADHIMKSLRWLGLDWDEGLEVGGDYGPYEQSQRLEIYKQWAQKLVDKGLAYADPYSQDELESFRDQAKKAKKPFLFRDYRPADPPDWDGHQPLRLRSEPKDYSWQDAVLGQLSAGPGAIDDFILIKSDGYPTYNFAHIIDDYLMQVSHVTRSTEFLSSVPRFLSLYEALGIEHPILATLPVVLGPDGKKKLSKRDGAKDILDYKREGYLPEALVNFMASLGWNDGTEQEIFTIDELIEKFSLERVQKNGSRFDEQRLLWMDGFWLRKLSDDALYERAKDFWPPSAKNSSGDYRKSVLALVQERIKYLAELPQLTDFFFEDRPVNLKLIDDNKQLNQFSHQQLGEMLATARTLLQDTNFNGDSLNNILNAMLEDTGQKPVVLFSLIRIATTWAQASPSLVETLALLGKETTLRRLDAAIEALS